MSFWKKKTPTPKNTQPRVKEESKSINIKNKKNALANVKNIIAVASGKGGVGKSTISVNLAKQLEKSGFKVGLLDADIYGPSIPKMLPTHQPKEMREDLVVPPKHENLKVISSGMFSSQKAHILRGPMAANFVTQMLTQVYWDSLDYLIVDYPPGTGDIQLSLSQQAPLTGAVIVTSPQEIALEDVKKACHFFNTLKVPLLGVVETMSWFTCDSCEKKHFLFSKEGGKKIAEQLAVDLFAQIPIDQRVTDCADSGEPVVSKFPDIVASKNLQSACKKLISKLDNLNSQTENNQALKSFSLKWQQT